MSSGKILEAFVEQIERILLPDNCAVTVNEKIYNDDGVQIAEFDIEIEGRVGSTLFRWLIECRDRPSEGPAPGSWIEQLVGRRDRFKFDKVIAVSTTGFSEGATEFAAQKGIDIRTVTEADLDDISDWFLIETMTLYRRGGRLNHATLYVGEDDSTETKEALRRVLTSHNLKEPILISTETNKKLSLSEACQAAVDAVGTLYEPIDKEGGSRAIRLLARYPKDESHFVLETDRGKIRIEKILFVAELTVTKEEVPVTEIKKYTSVSSSGEIATRATFAFDVEGDSVEMSLNKMTESGDTYVLLRRQQK